MHFVRSAKVITGLFAALAMSLPLAAAESPRGQIIGGAVHAAPAWFKQSFLDIAEDVAEASEADKHVLLFFQLNGCPYCDRMLRESFEAEPLSSLIQTHFDAISINVRGDREIAFNDEIEVTEKELSEILAVYSTPAILFLDDNNKTVARVNGYRAPERFRQVLEYVSTRAYRDSSLADFLRTRLDKSVYRPRPNPLFSDITDLSGIDGPLMVIFEDGACYDCDEFHDGILGHALVHKEVEAFTIVRLDADSDEAIIDVDGTTTTPAGLAQKHNMVYRPGILAFDRGELVRRVDSLLFPHHFKENMRFVAGGFHRRMDYQTYSAQRTEELLSQGIDIDLGAPR